MGRIAIIGLGLIGGSVGLALKRAEPKNTTVVGYDDNREVMARARRAGVVDETEPSLERAVREATMVVVATPIAAVRRVLRDIGPHLQDKCIVTDTASTKGDVMRWAKQELPERVYFVGGHPMAGREKAGLQEAEAELFDERPYCIVPSVDAVGGAVNAVVGLVQALGAKPFFLDADEHDAYVAAISHVPLISSVALFNLARHSNAWPELANISGPAFKDLTRLASGEPELGHDIFITNRENVLHWLRRYMAELQRLSELIESQDEEESLFRTLAEAQIEREQFLENPPERVDARLKMEMPTASDAFMSMMTGALWQEHAKRAQDMIVERTRIGVESEAARRRRLMEDEDD
ncbi:MAG TPA: prephenate dehydrogenase/arogenate dehydrogenase family protein [Dehalococcoidia bacterium]|nr:prephenate dehydrogenase/arogenate dehydrogenase family protein [Dehalococcoidia bacterium]